MLSPLLNEGHLVDFLERRDALAHLLERGVPQKRHAFLAGGPLDFRRGAPVDDHLANMIRQIQKFGNGAASAKSRAGTFQAASALDELHRSPLGGIETGSAQNFRGIAYDLLAMHANHAHQALGQNAVQSGNEIVRLDAHVDEPADDVGYVIGVHGGEHQVSGERRLNGDLSGFVIANFSDHDLVRVVPQDRTQAAGERQPLLFVDGDLRDSPNLVFDGIFNRDDFVFVGFNFVDGGVQRRRFSRPGRAGDEHHAVGLADVPSKLPHFFGRESDHVQAEVLKFFGERFLVQDAEDRVFSMDGRHDRNTEIDEASFIADPEAPILGHATLGDIQFAHDFDARNNSGKPVLGDRRHRVNQDAVNPVLDGHLDVPGLDIDRKSVV